MKSYWTFIILAITYGFESCFGIQKCLKSGIPKLLDEFTSLKNQCPAQLKDTSENNNMVLISEGTYQIGTDEPVFWADGESPLRQVYLDAFLIDKYEVSNQDFERFVIASMYLTEAEKFGTSFVFDGILGDKTKAKISKVVASAPWWTPVENTSWRFPEGSESSIKGI